MLTDGDTSTDGGTGGGTIIGNSEDIDCVTRMKKEVLAQLQMVLKTLSLVE